MQYQLLIQSVRFSIYVLVVSLLLISNLIEKNFTNWNLTYSFLGASIFGILLNLTPIFKLESYFQRRKLVFLTFLLDIGLITYLMVESQLNQALFLFLYLVIIILSGLVFNLRGSLLMAAVISIGYTISSWFGPEIKAMSFLFLMIVNNIFFFVVAGLSGYLSDQLSLFAEKIEIQNISLRVIRKLNEMIIETIPLGLLSTNAAGNILQFNPGASLLFGNQDLTGLSIFDSMPQLREKLQDFKHLENKVELDIHFKDGGEREPQFLKLQILPQSLELAEKTFLVVIEDLTEKIKLEFAVRQSEKMAAVGQLAAGIAHEIRNPLAGISGSVELLSTNFHSEDDKKLAKIIMKEIDRLNRLISEFLDFAKPEQPPGEIVDLNQILDEVLKSVGNNPLYQILVEKNYSQSAKILGHSDKLKQAFLNIIINSFQAMEKSEKKNLTISTENHDGLVILKIKDSGSGMKPETLKRMFEPFHTTKPKGTGLGLAITHKILETHSAKIFVESQIGLGTEFVISFPAKNN